jgi:hypothetical protein
MTNIWMLSKQSMKGLDLLEVIADMLSAQEIPREKVTDQEKKLKITLERGSELLQRFIDAAETQISRSNPKDIYIHRMTEELEKNLGLTPSKLAVKLEKCTEELDEGKLSSETFQIFEELSDIVMRITSRSVDVISTPVY